ncbi:MAG: aldo/keto reductase, partial [Ilumatobacter sp.]
AESIGTMLELREEGKIDMIGVSEVTVDELRQVQRLCDVAAVQNRFNVGDREWSDVVDACAADGIAFIPWFPLGSDDLGDAVEALDTVADAHGATRHGVALAWLLHRSSTMVPIPGTKTMTHLVDNVSSAHLVDAVTDDEWAMLDALA